MVNIFKQYSRNDYYRLHMNEYKRPNIPFYHCRGAFSVYGFWYLSVSFSISMQWFIDHPKFSSNPFYIGGGSYSGITTGPLVQKVYEGKITNVNLMT